MPETADPYEKTTHHYISDSISGAFAGRPDCIRRRAENRCRLAAARLRFKALFRSLQGQLFYFRTCHRPENHQGEHQRQIPDFDITAPDALGASFPLLSLSLLHAEGVLECARKLDADDRPQLQSRYRYRQAAFCQKPFHWQTYGLYRAREQRPRRRRLSLVEQDIVRRQHHDRPKPDGARQILDTDCRRREQQGYTRLLRHLSGRTADVLQQPAFLGIGDAG